MIKEGDILYGREGSRHGAQGIMEYKVAKVGRVYFEVDDYNRRRYSIKTLEYVCKNYSQNNHQLYKTKEEILDMLEHERLSTVIRDEFKYKYGKLPYSLEQLKKVIEILEIK